MTDSVIPILPQTRVIPLTIIRRDRLLTGRGQVVAAVGSRVQSPDVVAQSPGEGNLHLVPLGRYMHSSEAVLDKYLRKQPGEEVEPREIIASKPELFGTLQRIYRAPSAGRIAAIQGTWLALELAQAPIELRALYRGVVINVVGRQGVTIEAIGSLVQGAWGGGGEGYGVLKKIVEAPGDLVTEDKIDASVGGSILVAGAGVTEQAFRRAAQEQAAGLIVGSLLPAVKDLVIPLGLPTIVTEGFGEHAMLPSIFELLAAHHGEETILNASVDGHSIARPEVFIPAISTERESPNVQHLAPLTAQTSARVRLLAPPHEGAVGKIVEIPRLPQIFESGVSALGAEIELTGNERVFTPWQNLELID